MAGKRKVHKKTIITEVVEKKSSPKKSPARKSSPKKPSSNPRIETALIENFISLQKVMVNLSVKFDGLTNQISKLLELFEISAKALAERDFVTEKEKKENREVMDKMDEIIGQNKILARGLTLMHDRITEEGEIPFTPKMPAPRMQMPPKIPEKNSPVRELNNSSDDIYQRSISSHNGPKSI